jgi:hypothetical protein
VFQGSWSKKQGARIIDIGVIKTCPFHFACFLLYTHENDENNNNYTFSSSHTYRLCNLSMSQYPIKFYAIIKKEEIIMVIDWTLIVLIGILVCLVFICWWIIGFDEVSRRNMDKVYKYLEEIRDK